MDSDTTAMIAKEDRKQSEWHEIINARREIVASWPRDRCQIEAAKFVKNYSTIELFSLDDRFYARVDMMRDCDANNFYMDAVKEVAPQIFNKAMIEMIQRRQNLEAREIGIPKPIYLVEMENEGRLLAAKVSPETVQTLAKNLVDDLFSKPYSSIDQKLTAIQTCIETSPIFKSEIARTVPELITISQKHKEDHLKQYASSTNVAPTPYQQGKLSVNLSHAKDLKVPEARSIKR